MKESVLIDVFSHAGFFLILSAIVVPILRYFKIPTALGYLLVGIALGPYGLGALSEQHMIFDVMNIQYAEHVKILAELGIVLLLFVVGLELTPKRLWQMRNLVFGLGGAQVIVTAGAVGVLAFVYGNDAQVALLLGLGFALSSTAIVTGWLHEKKLFVTPVGRSSFSILLFQDLAVIPILLLLTILSANLGDTAFLFATVSLAKMILTATVIYVSGRIVLKPIFVFANKNGGSEVFMALSLLVIIASSSIAAYAGLSMALGAFLAGILLADTEYRHEIEDLIMPFKSMLLGIFFFSFGMGINLAFIAEKPIWLFSSVIGLIFLKATIIYALCKMWKQSTAVSVETAVLLSQAGEFGLLIVGSALTYGLMQENVAQFMLLNVGITMMLAPLMAPYARKLGDYFDKRENNQDEMSEDFAEELDQHVVIFGYGRVGQNIAEKLSKEGVNIIAFDKDVGVVHQARKAECPVFLGDLSKKATMKSARIDKAACVLVAVDDQKVTDKIVKSIKEEYETTPIIVRSRTIEDADEYNKMEYVFSMAEYQILSHELADAVFTQLGYHKPQTTS